ncbi:alpha beta hydrolase fold protein [Moniliophthora roreri MCA 2997]|uniref:Alpha beta hydrolase fold protein n=1 Tax=Moniliophthora roreri (strain MCA 2997) TaxID=1381753 RepID=V2X2A0_MONRO|nr:alpha beta hydrolase fold protein [Moniliophthora roreri MCA 2997]
MASLRIDKLTPNAPLPTILRQAAGGLRLFLNRDIQPKIIHLVGDLAGGNLILQLFSHILHPLSTVPAIPRHFPSCIPHVTLGLAQQQR